MAASSPASAAHSRACSSATKRSVQPSTGSSREGAASRTSVPASWSTVRGERPKRKRAASARAAAGRRTRLSRHAAAPPVREADLRRVLEVRQEGLLDLTREPLVQDAEHVLLVQLLRAYVHV